MQLAIDRVQVRIHRSWTDAQFRSDLGSGQSVGHEMEHLQFAAGESM